MLIKHCHWKRIEAGDHLEANNMSTVRVALTGNVDVKAMRVNKTLQTY
jgi:LEA14-like dessication related protein